MRTVRGVVAVAQGIENRQFFWYYATNWRKNNVLASQLGTFYPLNTWYC